MQNKEAVHELSSHEHQAKSLWPGQCDGRHWHGHLALHTARGERANGGEVAKCTNEKPKPQKISQCQIHQRHSVPWRSIVIDHTGQGGYSSRGKSTRHRVWGALQCMSYQIVALQGGASVVAQNHSPATMLTPERLGEPRDWAVPNTLGSSHLRPQRKCTQVTTKLVREGVAWQPNRPVAKKPGGNGGRAQEPLLSGMTKGHLPLHPAGRKVVGRSVRTLCHAERAIVSGVKE